MAILGFEIDEIARLLELAASRHLAELSLEEEGRSVRIRAARPPKNQNAMSSLPQPQSQSAEARTAIGAASAQKQIAGSKTKPAALAANQVELRSPMVGTFYRSETPGSAPLVNIGDQVAAGQTIGIIEAMKIFSEVPADHAGTVVEIPAKDGALVQANAVLMVLNKDE